MENMENNESHQIFFGDREKGSLSLDARRQKLLRWIDRYVSSSEGKVLDIGCWNGDFLRMLPSGWEKWGIDFERHPSLGPEVHFQTANVEEGLPVEAGCFDLVFAGEIIEHVRATQVFLQRCFETLKPGGILILTTPNLSCCLNLWRWFSLGQPFCVDSDTGQNGHVRYLAPLTLRNSLAKTGFHVLEMASAGGIEFLKIIS
jgi:2-polyprenyl-3-methyl-5-hydroxy-6-metoxy-1,4-benzoquinol methylase